MMTQANDKERQLDALTHAARDAVDETALDEAVQRFRARLPERSEPAADQRDRRSGWMPGWLKVAGTFATLVLAIAILPLVLPGKSTGQAFAQAQAWFTQYQTLQLTMVTRQASTELYRMKVAHETGGATRIDLGPVTHIVDPVRGEMISVMNGSEIMRKDLPRASSALADQESMGWLEELRSFQGEAEAVAGTRVIDGVDAQGWSLSLSGLRHTLWVDPSDYRPLKLEGDLGGGATLEIDFVFDAPLSGDTFTPPVQR